MNLGQLIDTLRAESDQQRVVPRGFTTPHSYRGYYECVAFEPATDVVIAQMLQAAEFADGHTFTAWKGGEYSMRRGTDVYLAEQGDTGDELSALLLDYMLAATATPEVVTEAAKAAQYVTPKGLREAVCAAQAAVAEKYGPTPWLGALSALIPAIDEHRPLGTGGKHGDLHTATCGCEGHRASWSITFPAEPPRVLAVGDEVTTAEELDLLPALAVIRDLARVLCERHGGSDTRWYCPGGMGPYKPALPATVLDLPEATS